MACDRDGSATVLRDGGNVLPAREGSRWIGHRGCGIGSEARARRLARIGIPDGAQVPLGTDFPVVIRPQPAGAGVLHRLSLDLPAGLADGLALKELRYTATRGDSPLAGWPLVPPRPCAGLRLDGPGHPNRPSGRNARAYFAATLDT